jgi:menaquinone-specific isochorismate synthase
MALAGTRQKEKFTEDPESFLRDPKELREHQIVIDDIVERLQTAGTVKVGKTASLELNYLAHLYTPIQMASNDELSFEKLVDLLHPTPALGISPRAQIELLRKWRDPKDILGAPFGVRWEKGAYLCVVAIRQLQWDEKFYYIGNGCGIVAESEFDDEWNELKIKRDSVRRMFKL